MNIEINKEVKPSLFCINKIPVFRLNRSTLEFLWVTTSSKKVLKGVWSKVPKSPNITYQTKGESFFTVTDDVIETFFRDVLTWCYDLTNDDLIVTETNINIYNQSSAFRMLNFDYISKPDTENVLLLRTSLWNHIYSICRPKTSQSLDYLRPKWFTPCVSYFPDLGIWGEYDIRTFMTDFSKMFSTDNSAYRVEISENVPKLSLIPCVQLSRSLGTLPVSDPNSYAFMMSKDDTMRLLFTEQRFSGKDDFAALINDIKSRNASSGLLNLLFLKYFLMRRNNVLSINEVPFYPIKRELAPKNNKMSTSFEKSSETFISVSEIFTAVLFGQRDYTPFLNPQDLFIDDSHIAGVWDILYNDFIRSFKEE